MPVPSKPFLHLALQWQGHNDAVMAASFCKGTDETVVSFLSEMQHYSPSLLVVLKAWEGGSMDWESLGAETLKTTPSGTWLKASKELRTWLEQQQGINADYKRLHGLARIPGVIWRTLAPSKAQQCESLEFPSWACDAFNAALFILGTSSNELSVKEMALQCKGIYSEKTVRNALNKLKKANLAKSYGEPGMACSWALTKAGQAIFLRNY